MENRGYPHLSAITYRMLSFTNAVWATERGAWKPKKAAHFLRTLEKDAV